MNSVWKTGMPALIVSLMGCISTPSSMVKVGDAIAYMTVGFIKLISSGLLGIEFSFESSLDESRS